ncbi:MAG: oligopeptide transporter, OPT family [Holophagaceae bacterium]|nr:oligopeptide transporter, OPT family [Holophagaceae bacterium]
MSHPPSDNIKGLPENARRPLGPGEKFVPLVPHDGVLETTPRAIFLGLVFCAIFSMAAAYLALKLGQGIEAAIPIAILAVGLSRFFARKNTILENVIIQSIGANSSHVVSGAVFTIPALYMLATIPGSGVETPSLAQVVMVSFLGGSIGILFLIPLRHNFMVENHGVFPWPEATATTEIIVTGEKAGNQAKTLVMAALIGGLYDGLTNLFRTMAENIRLINVGPSQWLGRMQEKAFMRFDYLNSAATLGIGYIIGLRYTAIIAAGSFFATFVLVPMVHGIAYYAPISSIVPPGTIPMDQMGAAEIFRDYVRIIGVGCIAGAGVMGVLSSLPSMMRSIVSNLKALKKKGSATIAVPGRTERSIPGSFVAVGLAVFAIATILFFSFGIGITDAIVPALLGTAVVMVISFFFAPVAARAIATIGTNPISGMTMLTLLITGLVMLKLGFTGGTGMFVTMMVGGVVCTALAASGAFSTDLKIGHWIGSTPARQIGWKFVGTLVAALFCGVAMFVMSKGGFGAEGQYAAPQASAMRAILEGIFGTTAMPLRWYFFGLGIVLSLVLRIINLPALGFALGMYLPIELNTPLFMGGILSHFVNKKKANDTDESAKERENKGILIASGLMAGGAIIGVIGAMVRMNEAWQDGFYILNPGIIEGSVGEWLAIIGMVGLCTYVVISSRRSPSPLSN